MVHKAAEVVSGHAGRQGQGRGEARPPSPARPTGCQEHALSLGALSCCPTVLPPWGFLSGLLIMVPATVCQCVLTLTVAGRLLSFWEMAERRDSKAVSAFPGVAVGPLAGDKVALASGSPGAGLATHLPIHAQVAPGRDPTALRAALPGPGRAPRGVGPLYMLPCSQVRAWALVVLGKVPGWGRAGWGMLTDPSCSHSPASHHSGLCPTELC